MALKPRKAPFDCETVEAIAAGVTADPSSPSGEWVVKEGSVWQSSHPVVALQPAWFVPLGAGRTTPAYFPAREPSS